MPNVGGINKKNNLNQIKTLNNFSQFFEMKTKFSLFFGLSIQSDVPPKH